MKHHEFNNWHPMPRYGLAAALKHLEIEPVSLSGDEQLYEIARIAIKRGLNRYMLKAQPASSPDYMNYHYLSSDKLAPGSASGQIAANGCYTAPHITTSNNSANLLKEVEKIAELLAQKSDKTYELKRSFAPMVSKLNAGKLSMSNPKVHLLPAAFTAVAALTELKPASYENDNNIGLFLDLPFYDSATATYPLYEFVDLFERMQFQGLGDKATLGKYDGKKYYRPGIFNGNYPEAPQLMQIGAVSLLAALGKWARTQEVLIDRAEAAMTWMEGRPIYLISDGGTQLQRFGHHLTKLAQSGHLHSATTVLYKVSLFGIEDKKKLSNNNWKLFVTSFDHFLRFFNATSFADFLAFRAEYPIEFSPLLKTYFMEQLKGKYDEHIIKSAVAYGYSLNLAAYKAAKREEEDDESKGRTGRGVQEYKHRTLLQLESIIQSATGSQDLIARLNSQVARLTMEDIHSDGQDFIEAVVNERIDWTDAKNLIMAFMRLRGTQRKKEEDHADDEMDYDPDDSSSDGE